MTTATDILKANWDGKLPVDVKKIASALGIAVSADPFLGVSGSIDVGSGKPVIKYNSSEAAVRQRFTIAHEIGHFALGHLSGSQKLYRDDASNFSSGTKSAVETEANSFAAKLLMPGNVVRFAVSEKNITSVEKLAEIFGVSQVAMKYRLINLGLARG